jgi:hypothetical protein
VYILRGKEQEELRTVVEDLLSGRPELVCVAGAAVDDDHLEGLARLDISFPGEDLADDFDEPDSEDKSSWIWMARRKNSSVAVPSKQWKRRYAVLSGAVLSFYEAASPRPHGLRVQVVLRADTVVSTKSMEPPNCINNSNREGTTRIGDAVERGRHVVSTCFALTKSLT